MSMDNTSWARWMDLLGRGSDDEPGLRAPSTVNAYVIDGTQWPPEVMEQKLRELRRSLRENPPEGPDAPWVIVEHGDGHRQVVWPA